MKERLIKLENLPNFRDFKDLKTQDGTCIKSGIFYRSARLDRLNNRDIETLKNYNINTVIDYRNYHEMLKHISPPIKGVTTYVLPAIIEDVNEAQLSEYFTESNMSLFYDRTIEMYKSLPFDNSAYRLLIDLIAQTKDHIILQHCTAGRDRTGFGSALILLLLNVDIQTIIDDYLLSNIGLLDFYEKMLEDYHLDDKTLQMVISMIELKPDYIEAALNEIIKVYDTYEQYFLEEYNLDNLDLNRIRRYYTK